MGLSTALLVAHPQSAHAVRAVLNKESFVVVEGGRPSQATATRHEGAALAVIACGLEDQWDAIAAARALRAADSRLRIIFLAESSSEALAIAALKAGVSDYCRGPFDVEVVTASLRARGPDVTTPRAVAAATEPPTMIGEGPAMRAIRSYIEKVGSTDANVLITGETGTGKELVAELLHCHSPRRQHAFVTINCAAIPDGLLESELFGNERGAFTGAHTARDGHLRAANGGTVLLDEIGEMTPLAQAKILRALDTREVYRLGSTRRLLLNVRVIAATNQDLDGLIERGSFRKDLFYRLDVARVRLPPLRERREDIPALLTHYVNEMNARYHRSVSGFTAESLQVLVAYHWPGNVREMKNVLEGIYLEMPKSTVRFIEAPARLRDRVRHLEIGGAAERDRLLAALRAANWNKSLAAQHLQWSRMTLYRKLAKYQVSALE